MPRLSLPLASMGVQSDAMTLMFLLADAAVGSRPRLNPGELLWAAIPLIGILLIGALFLYLFDRWRKRVAAEDEGACDPNDQLSHFRSLYERGEMSREEFESVKALLAGQLRREMNVAARSAPAPASSVTETPPSDTNVQAKPPDPQSPPPPEAPPG
jgi:hypothetical protein